MSDMLYIAQSGVRAYARALDVVADNVANAATPGHVRRTATLSPAMAGGASGPLELDRVGGGGVRLTSVGRAVDALQADTLRRAEGQVSALEAGSRWLSTLQATLAGPAAIDGPWADTIDALSDLVSEPTDLALRQGFLLRAGALADRFRASTTELERLHKEIGAEATAATRDLTAFARGLADVNAQLRRATPGSSASAALADQRDRLLSQMSAVVGIEVQFDRLGQATVRIPDAGGPALVEAGNARSARIVEAASGFELRIGPKGHDELAPITSGLLAGLSSARSRVSDQQNRLDNLASRISHDFNELHQNGVDLAGADGGALFTTAAPTITGDAGNGGSARVSAALADGATLADSTLVYDGVQWTLANAGGAISGALPLTLDGLTVDTAGDAGNGDVFRITSARPAAAIALRPLAPEQLALSARWLGEPAPGNGGTGGIELKADSPSAIPATPPFTISVLPGGQAQLQDSLGALLASGPANGWLTGDGFAVRLSGAPATGDSFRIERAGAGEGNNGNALALLSLRDRQGPTGTIETELDSMRSTVTVALAEARTRHDIAKASRNGAAEALQAGSGVDLNTEAAEMLRLQQAFQANARIIQTSREIFDAILAAAR